MKKFIIQFVLLILIIAAGFIFFVAQQRGQTVDLPFVPSQPKFASLEINGVTLRVEVADTDEKRKRGLSGKTELAENEGMLFVYQKDDRYSFWMKGLKFPLDFVWIKDNQVVGILIDVQPSQEGQDDSTLPIYAPATPINKVLEVNAGTVQRLDIRVGDTVKIEY